MASRFLRWMSCLAIVFLGTNIVCAQPYPNKTVRIVTAPIGGGADLVSRLVAQGLSGAFGERVVVDNRGGGAVAPDYVFYANPDGYTLLLSGTLWLLPTANKNLRWDPVKGFFPISLPARAPNVLVVHPSMPVKTVKELIALAKARPGEINYASGPPGTPNFIAGELFKALAHVDVVGIRYRGGGASVASVLSGEGQFVFAVLGLVEGHAKAGRLRQLAIATAKRSVLAPNLPTVAEAGVPGFESAVTYGLFAPLKTPEPIIERLHKETVAAVKQADLEAKFNRARLEVIAGSPKDLTDFMTAEMAKVKKVMRNVGRPSK